MTVTCKLCGTPISSLDINKKKRRIEIQRKIANHIKAVHKDTVDILVHNALVLTDLISQYIHLDLTNIPALDTDAQEYKDELTDTILGIMEIELDNDDNDNDKDIVDDDIPNEDIYSQETMETIPDIPVEDTTATTILDTSSISE